MSTLSLQLAITLHGPLHIGTGAGLAALVDEQTVSGPAPERSVATPYVPASSLKGRLRWQMAEIAQGLHIPICAPGERCPHTPPCAASLLFGGPEREGALRLTDAHLSQAELDLATLEGTEYQPLFLTGRRHFVALSRVRRVARPQQLVTIEQVAGGSRFACAATADLEPPYEESGLPAGAAEHVPLAVALLVAAGLALTHLGGHKARGLGRVDLSWQEVRFAGQDLEPAALLQALETRGGQA